MMQQIQACHKNQIGAAICLQEFVGPEPDCDVLKQIALYTSKCDMDDCIVWYLNGVQIEGQPDLTEFTPTATVDRGILCQTYTTQPFIMDADNVNDITLKSLIDLAFDAESGSLEYPDFGSVLVDDDIMEINVVAEDEDDVLMVNQQESSGFSWTGSGNKMSTVPFETILNVPADCEYSISICFQKCLTKKERALL